jgi:SAM-dependent methyltransferase
VKSIEYTPAGYWDRRYREGRTSGAGSEGSEGQYKADYVSDFIHNRDIKSVIDWGCGDGQVLDLIRLEDATYIGVDVSPTIVDRMRKKYPYNGYQFMTSEYAQSGSYLADLTLSMDVLFHLPDDSDYFGYLDNLFGSASRFVIIYATNTPDGRTARHVFRREFTPDIADRFPDWELKVAEEPLRPGLASFFVYEKVS